MASVTLQSFRARIRRVGNGLKKPPAVEMIVAARVREIPPGQVHRITRRLQASRTRHARQHQGGGRG